MHTYFINCGPLSFVWYLLDSTFLQRGTVWGLILPDLALDVAVRCKCQLLIMECSSLWLSTMVLLLDHTPLS